MKNTGISILPAEWSKRLLTTVSDKYTASFAFTGKLKRITIDLSDQVVGSNK
jgi:hypothetical protein